MKRTLSKFKIRAVIDWIDIKIHTSRPTQQQWVQAELRKLLRLPAESPDIYVEALDKAAGSTANAFRLRLHDESANRASAIHRISEGLAARFGEGSPAEVVGVEIAIDFYSRKNDSASLRGLTYRLQTSLSVDGLKPRQFDPSLRQNRWLDDRYQRIDPNLSLRLGNRWDDVSWQVYWKRVDAGRALPAPLERARAEVTLSQAALVGFRIERLCDLVGVRFETFAHLFRFRVPVDECELARSDKFVLTAVRANRRVNDASPGRGMHSYRPLGRRDRRGRLRLESRHVKADIELTKVVDRSLRHLTDRFTNNFSNAPYSKPCRVSFKKLSPINCNNMTLK